MSPLISLTSVSQTFGTRPLFTEISLVVSEGDKTALLGANGAGKSTLMKIMAGLLEPDSGTISSRKGLSVSYVPQNENFDPDVSVEEVLRAALPATTHDIEARISIHSGKMGFTDISTKVRALSGGWRKRLSIACAVINEPELLLLDEPTNHLDLDSILWLEDFLLELDCGIVFISHDRYLIERIAKRVIELDRSYPRGFLASDGSYSDFLETRANFLAQRASYSDSLQNKVRREVEWLRQGVRARGTKAKGRIKEAGKMIDELDQLKFNSRKAGFEFAESTRETKELIDAKEISKTIAGKALFRNLTFTLKQGIKLGIVGSNGTGKTTLLKVILGNENPDTGKIRIATKLQVAYFDQLREELDPNITLRRALAPDGDGVIFNGREVHVASWAERFLFRNEQLSLLCGSLSGGERARVLLSRLMLQPSDLLILDEPTNDLDIPTLEVLEDTLIEYQGGIVLVTHDRQFVNKVCTHVVGLSGDGVSAIYADYNQFAEDREKNKSKKPAKQSARIEQTNPKDHSANRIKLTYAERIELGKITKQITGAEDLVIKLQDEIGADSKASDQNWLKTKCEELAQAKQHVDNLYERWQQLESKRSLEQ